MLLQSGHIVQPFIIELGPLQMTGFGIAVLMAFWISTIVVERELARRGHLDHSQATPDIVFAALLGTLIGAKVYYTILTGDVSTLWSRGGFVFWGGFMGSVLLCYITIKRKKLDFLRYSDVAGIAIAAGYAVGRTGCFAVGDDYGRPWNGPLASAFPNGAPPSTAENMRTMFGATNIPADVPPDTVIAVHPTQLYETALGLVMFAVLWRLRGHKHAEGWLFGLYCVLAGAERFVIEFFRAKDDRFFGPFTAAQVIALAIAAIGVAVMYARRRVGPGAPGIYAAQASPAAA